jgi:long-chain acyl-CoA synthetase
MKYTLKSLISHSFQTYPDNPSLGFVGEKSLSYAELEKEVNAVCAFYEKLGLVKGDKVAILSANMPNWGISFFAMNFMGIIAVPILPDFHPDEIRNILVHSESKAILVSSRLYHKIKDTSLPSVTKILLENFNPVKSDEEIDEVAIRFSSLNYSVRPLAENSIEESDIASIIYTSGTTGTSKGVMLSNKNIASNAFHCRSIFQVKSTDVMLSVLPLSHSYENTIGLVLPIINGAEVKYSKNPPTPAVLMDALKKVRPTVMLSVPLIIEKIYKGKVLPGIRSKNITRILYKTGFGRKLLHRVAGKKLMETFGGRLQFFGLGGAKVSAHVEKFLQEARFPYAIGYGLTETSPLLCGSHPGHTEFQSTGLVMEGVEIKIHEPNAESGEGEIWAKGPNIMQGYYKDPEMTASVITKDGWFKTGDLGLFDKKGNLHIKGRIKNMIVGSSGENIYPEEIESVINAYPYVLESLVLERKGKLVAMVHLNMEELEQKFLDLKDKQHEIEARLDEILKEIQLQVNATVNKFSQLQVVLHQSSPFERTPTQKVKRFLYS